MLDSGILYILALCLVDLSVILSIPLSIIQILVGHWILGNAMCTIYWTLESGGKILSAFILTALSFDRFMTICQPMKTRFRSPRFTAALILCLAIVGYLLLLPLPLHARVESQVAPYIHTVYGNPTRFEQSQCSTNSMSNSLFNAFTLYIFVIGFCVPAVSIILFYSTMLGKLSKHTRNVRQSSHSSIPIRKITIYTLVIAIFYFVCWLPYWVGTLYFLISKNAARNTSRVFVYIMLFVHALPYLNSAFNWILYALLNSQVLKCAQEEGYGSRLHYNTTTNETYTIALQRNGHEPTGVVGNRNDLGSQPLLARGQPDGYGNGHEEFV